jgi:NADH-quinone oxidoreductase subunit J
MIVLGLSVLVAFLLVVIFAVPLVSGNITALYPIVDGAGNTQEVGMVLFTKYLVPFELAAIMLLVAMVAGIVLAGKKMDLSLTLMNEAQIREMRDEENKKVLS